MGIRQNIEAEGFGFNRNECSFCGCKDWNGYWLQRGLVEVCPDCARKVLPALYADAMRTKDWGPVRGLKDLLHFAQGYWRATMASHRHNSRRARIARKSHKDGD